ncbi:MAG: hypothetical protein WBO97_09220 [Tepidiformaceae bacterium]
MFQELLVVLDGRVATLRDGRVAGFHPPEPEFLRRRYEHAQVLRELKREDRLRALLEDESQGFVERIRQRLGLAQ